MRLRFKSAPPISPKATVAAFVAAIIAAASTSAWAAFEFRVPIQGLLVNSPQSPALSPVGDGVSKAGACAIGVATGCAVWQSAGLAPAVAISGNPALNLYTTDCNTSASCDAQATKSISAGKWYWEIKLTTLTLGFGGILFGIAPPGGRLNTTTSVYYYTYNGGQFYKGGTGQTQANAGLVQGDVYGWAVDMDAKTVAVTRNGKPLASVTLPAGMATVVPTAGEDWYLANGISANFGQNAFAYPVPAGYHAGLW